MATRKTPRLQSEFYKRDTITVARELLGCRLVHILNGQRLSGIITETEAYVGIKDPACHTFGDRRTPRTKSMYLSGGHSYVYFIYGMHFCFNVVTRDEASPEAVLIRAIVPEEGINEMKRRRKKISPGLSPESVPKDLTNGPAKLCQALGIDRSCDGLLLTKGDLFIESSVALDAALTIHASPRIGVGYAGEAASWPLRFTI